MSYFSSNLFLLHLIIFSLYFTKVLVWNGLEKKPNSLRSTDERVCLEQVSGSLSNYDKGLCVGEIYMIFMESGIRVKRLRK